MTQDEGAAENVKNVIQCFAHPAFGKFDFTPAEAASIVARLQRVLEQIQDLEGLAIGRREQELGIMLDRAEYIAREFPPLDYPVPAVEDRLMAGQDIEAGEA